MKKQLNVSAVVNELAGGSIFFPSYKKTKSPISPIPKTVPSLPVVETPQKPIVLQAETKQTVSKHPNTKRIITRNSFEIYQDQMDSLRRLAYREKTGGKIGSMSAMVRSAIDNYLKPKSTDK
jgi:hypothetical protein